MFLQAVDSRPANTGEQGLGKRERERGRSDLRDSPINQPIKNHPPQNVLHVFWDLYKQFIRAPGPNPFPFNQLLLDE